MTERALGDIRLDLRITSALTTIGELESGVARAIENGWDSVTISPWLVRPASRLAGRSGLRVVAAIGLDSGTALGSTDAQSASRALEHGATALEVTLNGGRLLSGDEAGVGDDLTHVVDLAHSALAPATVALPAGLSEAARARACLLIERAGADAVAVGDGDAGPADVVALTRHIRKVAGPRLEITAIAAFTSAGDAAAVAAAGAATLSAAWTDALIFELGRPAAVALA